MLEVTILASGSAGNSALVRCGDTQILLDAGVRLTENAGCAACLGGPVDTFGRMNQGGLKCISATNRNFPGRMGSKESEVYLASPATVAASATRPDHEAVRVVARALMQPPGAFRWRRRTGAGAAGRW